MKSVSTNLIYPIPDKFPYIARNIEGILHGFVNAPVRDNKNGMWIDSVTGDYGEVILYPAWDTSVRTVTDLFDTRTPRGRNEEKQRENARKAREHSTKRKKVQNDSIL
jgi:hypothetical protein